MLTIFWKELTTLFLTVLLISGCGSIDGDGQAVILATAVSFNQPTGLATDSKNNLYTVDSKNVKLSPAGALITTSLMKTAVFSHFGQPMSMAKQASLKQ